MTRAAVLLAILLAACSSGKGTARRAEIVRLGPSTIRIVPAEGQPPYCLAFTVSERGVVRQLTMGAEGTSFECPARAPIGGVAYEIPPAEGKVRIYVVFSDTKLKAAPIAAQVQEMGAALTAMDLRAPGNVVLETIELTPEG